MQSCFFASNGFENMPWGIPWWVSAYPGMHALPLSFRVLLRAVCLGV